MTTQGPSVRAVTFFEWTTERTAPVYSYPREDDRASQSDIATISSPTVETRTALKTSATSVISSAPSYFSGASVHSKIRDAWYGRFSKSRMHLPDGSWVRLQQNEAFVEAFRKIVKGSEVWQRRLAIEKLKNQYKWTVSELLRSAREEMTYRTQFFYRIALHGFACDSRKATNSRAVITVGWNALPVTWRRSWIRRRKKIV